MTAGRSSLITALRRVRDVLTGPMLPFLLGSLEDIWLLSHMKILFLSYLLIFLGLWVIPLYTYYWSYFFHDAMFKVAVGP